MSRMHGYDICTDSDSSSSDSSCHGHHRRHHHRRRHCHTKLIPIGRVTVDCTPVSFESPCQVRTVMSCPVTQTNICSTVQVTEVQVPVGCGCVQTVPISQTIQFPFTTTVNSPVTLTPFPTIVCPQPICCFPCF